ncbi:phage tail spike protein [Enterococcus sp. BWR-S5]|uniref:phage tail spike protein n=1 Tax=Enterococcus sp. BWR-S5 TaxID=2787714 RepID=UPI00192488D6|nr:phage tail spike protein [Enterococcus sp. BWR-S5]MBL1224784.1 phage tail protein [Enterococcus sp. BWR-S5]
MKPTSSVYFFDEKQQFIRMVTRKYLTQNKQEKEITADKSELLNDQLTVSTVFDKEIEGAAYMAVKETDGSFSMYEIQNAGDPDDRNNFVGVNFAVTELAGYIVKDIRPTNRTVNYVANQILGFTDGEWRLGYVKPNLPIITDTFYYLSVKDSLKQLQTHGVEILFKCKIEGRKITDKWIEIYDKIGTASNKRFVYGGSALSIVKEQDRSQLYTSLIGRGKGEEVGDGYGRRIEFTDVVWRKTSGKQVFKPAGQNWVELPEMTEKYGIPLKSGGMRKREGVVVFDDIEDPETLLLNTYNALVEISRPLVHFKTEILSGDEVGNTIQVHRYDRDYHYRARIFKVAVDRLTGLVTSEVGDNLAKKSSVKSSSEIQLNLERIDEEKASFYTSEQIAQYQSDIIRGARGGSFLILNEWDLGISDNREPFCSVWMNGKSLETSDHFFVVNSEGAGFIDGDFNLNNFHTAWTIDGVFNARFIQTGILAGPNFYLDLDTGVCTFAKGKITSLDGKSEWNLTSNYFKLDNGQAIRLDPGKVAIYNGTNKIAQFDSRGNGFWRDSKEIGYIGTSSWSGKPSVRGLAFNLENEGGDYMTWSYRTSSTSDVYTTMLTVDPKGQTGYNRAGIFADLDLYVSGSKGVFTNLLGTRDRSKEMKIMEYTISGNPGIGLIYGNAGVIITSSDVFIKTSSGIYSFQQWVVNS